MGTVKRKGVAEKPQRAGVAEGVAELPRAEIDGEVAPEELEMMENEVSVDRQLRQWVDRENPERMTVRTYIYRYDNPTTGDLKTLVDRLDGDIPDPHEVGIQYGSGRYCMMVSIPEGAQQERKVKALRFRLHPRYDELRKNAAVSAAPGAAPASVVVAQGATMRDGIEMVRTVVEMLAPMFAATRAPAGPDVNRLLEEQYATTQRILDRSLENSQKLMGEIQRAQMVSRDEGGDVDQEPDFLSRVMPLVEQFLPLLLGGGQGAKATAAAVRAIPQVQQVIADADELARVIAWLDKTYGRDRSDKVLDALKVRRPKVNGKVHSSGAPLRLASAGCARV